MIGVCVCVCVCVCVRVCVCARVCVIFKVLPVKEGHGENLNEANEERSLCHIVL